MRNRTLIAMLYRSGLASAKLWDLLPKDADLAAGAIRVLHGKGDKSRTVGIDGGALAMVEQWLTMRTRWGVNGCHPILCTRTGQRMGHGYIRRGKQ